MSGNIKKALISIIKHSVCAWAILMISHAVVRAQINTPQGATMPFGENTGYAYGMMPDSLPSSGTGDYGHAQAAADAYNNIRQNWVDQCDDGSARIMWESNNESVSEGIAYGMLLAAYAADKSLFDGLWQFYKQNTNGNGFMHWHIQGCSEGVIGSNGASDAEVDAAMALIIADYQWPDAQFGTDPHDYDEDAVSLLTAMAEHEIDHGNTYALFSGDQFTSCWNASYQAPSYYHCYKSFLLDQGVNTMPNGEDTETFWDKAIEAGETMLANSSHETSGLVSNWNDDGTGSSCGGCSASNTSACRFGEDASRTPWRGKAMSVLWYGSSTMQEVINTQADFWIDEGGAAVVSDREHDGSGGVGNHISTYIGPVGALSMGATSTPERQNFANDMYGENVAVVDSGAYFSQMLRTLSLFVQTGQFWNPCDASSNTGIDVSITNPPEDTSLSGCDLSMTLEAEASAEEGSISLVEFYVDGEKIGEAGSSPYSVTWENIVPGEHSISVTATNSDSESASSVTRTVSVMKQFYNVSNGPEVDGTGDSLWNTNLAEPITKTVNGSVSDDNDLSASFKGMYTSDSLYLLVDVVDDTLVRDNDGDYRDDGLEIFIDVGNDKNTSYGQDDYQFTYSWADGSRGDLVQNNGSLDDIGVIHYNKTDQNDGYRVEMAIPWSDIGLSYPTSGTLLGIDVQVNDDDDGNGRDAKIAWNAPNDNAHQNPSLFGTIELGSAPCNGQDSDGDGVNDSQDGCPYDANKTEPGDCGCGEPDTDTDGDGTADCNDDCPDDPEKTEPGVCGCGVPDEDSNDNGVIDCNESGININLSAPASGDTLGECESLNITAEVSSVDSPVSGVEFYANDTLIGEDTTEAYEYEWSGIESGIHTISAIAINENGGRDTSAEVEVSAHESLFGVPRAPEIDGQPDDIWGGYPYDSVENVIVNDISGADDLSARFKVAWDSANIYVLANVTDDTLVSDGGNIYENDGVEIYLDMGNEKAGDYDDNDYQITYTWDDTSRGDLTITNGDLNADAVSYGMSNTDDGYILEFALPWDSLGTRLTEDDLLGFDFHVNDDDDGDVRDKKISWNADSDYAWQNPSMFGTLYMGTGACGPIDSDGDGVNDEHDDCPFDPEKTEPGDCGCGNTETECLDCNGEPYGEAFIDSCGTCAGGTTGEEPVTNPDSCTVTTINSADVKNAVKVYPNPSSGTVFIDVPGDMQGTARLTDLKGTIHREAKIKNGEMIRWKGLPHGMHLLRLKVDDAVYYYKLTIQ